MSLLRSIEKRIEHLVEGAFGRAFRSQVQPVEIARRLAKEMDENQSTTLRRVFVPNVYDVFLSRDDYRQLSKVEAALCNEMAEYLADHARRAGYSMATRAKVSIHRDADLDTGSFGIAVSTDEAPAPPVETESAGHTMVFQQPVTPEPVPVATSVALRLSGMGSSLALTSARAVIGRGRRNDLVLADPSVSREHAEVVAAGGGHTIRDLGSTNGMLVNGVRVSEHHLQPGDTVVLGNVTVRCEAAGSAGS